MTTQACITIVGTGLVGASIGMAIRKAKGEDLLILGHDKDPRKAKQAQKMEAIDKTEWNLISACSQADMIVLAIPVSEMRETLELIASDLKSGCVITDTCDVKGPVLEWADKLLPPEVSFIGGNPVLFGGESGLEAARPDLFKDKSYCLIPSSSADPDGVKLITDLVLMLGATPHYLDPYEHDGLLGGTEHLADALAAIWLHTLSSSSGWQDMRRTAGSAFDRITRFSTFNIAEHREHMMLNKDNILRWLDAFEENVHEFRGIVARQDGQALENYYTAEIDAREKWHQDRETQNWGPSTPKSELPSAGEMLSQLFFGKLFSGKSK